jgi:YVTN family beta-propeller protein
MKSLKLFLVVRDIAITPDGSELWVTNTKDNSITVIKTSNYKVTNTLMIGKPLKLKFSIDGKYCLVCNTDGTISIYNQKSKRKSKLFISMAKQPCCLKRICITHSLNNV